MPVDDGTIREIKARIDIASYIGSHVQLRKRGNDLVGLCPFHAEKTPSFHVHPDKGFFKCFGCGAGGDVITFAQLHENLTFPDAKRMLAQRAGVELEPQNPQAARARNERELIYEANRIAVAFFERMLREPAGAKARTYCEKRGLSEATIEKFHLGYAPDEWEGLTRELARNNVEAALAEKAGLLKRGERGYYDFYRDRLIVPTYSTTGEAIAFGGRLLHEGEPKYINTMRTPVYEKGQHLFALNVARRAASHDRTLIVVEGYLDCIALHQAGFESAVAALGTSFTQDQAKELRKYADGIFLCFDADTAGNAAAAKAIETAAQVIEHAGSGVRIVELPEGSDPDGFVREQGPQAFAELLKNAKPAIEFRLEGEVARLQTGFNSPAAIAREAEALIRRLIPAPEWDRWRVWIAQRLHLNVDDLRNSRFLANSANFGPRQLPVTGHRARTVLPSSFERDVLAIIVEEPALLRDFRDRIPQARFRNEVYRRIYDRLASNAEQLESTTDVFTLFGDDSETLELLSGLSQRDRSSILPYTDSDERRAHLERVVERLQLDDERERYRELSLKIDELATAGQNISTELRGEYDSLVAKLKNRKEVKVK
jgi:DNA primase